MRHLSSLHRLAIAVTAIAGAIAAPRAVAAGPTLKADFLCGVFVDDAITDIVPSAKQPRLEQPVACVLHLPKASRGSYQGTIATVRHLEGSQGDVTDIANDGTSGPVAHAPGAEAVDLEVVMIPEVEDAHGEVPFAPCERFDIVGRITDQDGALVFTRTLKVTQACPHIAPPPAALPPGRFAGRGVGNDAVDWVLSGDGSQPWRAFGVQVGAARLYLIGGCTVGGAETTCEATLFDRRGKRRKALAVTIADPMSEDEEVDLTELELARADLDAAIDHAIGYELTAHPLGPQPLTYDVIGLAWNSAKATLTIRDGDKPWKTVKAPRTPRGMAVTDATLYYLEGGDPEYGVLRVHRSELEGIGQDDALVVTKLPTIAVD